MYNDVRPVPAEWATDVFLQLRQRFGAASCETQIIHGMWQHQEMVFRDELTRMFVDVDDTPENRQFFVDLKERLKAQFEQIDIWITTYPIESI